MSVPAKNKSFIERKRPIDALRRKLARCSNACVETLEEVMNNKENSIQERTQAARILLSTYTEILHKDSQDKIKRLEMQLKYKEAIDLLNGTTAQDDDDSPMLDFENISEV